MENGKWKRQSILRPPFSILHFPFCVLALGFTALVGQALLLRELLAAFGGQELSLGIALAGWLLLVGGGAAATGWAAERLKWGAGAFTVGQCLLALLLPLELLAARRVKEWVGLSVFDTADFLTTSFAALLLLAPLCLLLGGQFTLACRVAADEELAGTPRPYQPLTNAVGRVYLYESAGALAGGVLFSFIFITALDPLPMAGLLGLLNITAAFLLRGWQGRTAPTSLLVLSLGCIILCIVASRRLERSSLQRQWRGLRVVDSHRSHYGHLVVTERHGSYTFYENGLLMFSLPSAMECEETAHYTLLQHPAPRRVLLIGGGVSGLLRETLRHPVERVDYVELDPLLISLAQRYMNERDRRALNDPRVHVWHTDGRLFVQAIQRRGGASLPALFDAIIVNLPDPLTAQLNRFYTVEFAQEVKRLLRPDGLVSLGLSSGETYRAPETRLLNACLYNTLRHVFTDVLVVPGERAMFLASPTKGVLTSDAQTLTQRFQQRQLTLDYLTPYDFELRLAPDRLDELRREFAENAHVPINRDLKPICYYYNAQRESAQWQTGKWKMESRRVGTLFSIFLSRLSLWWFVVPVLLTCCLWIGAQWRKFARCKTQDARRHTSLLFRAALLWTLFCAGFAAMALEIVLLLAFQSFYGYVYHQVCLLVTAFMAGMTFGAWAGQRSRGGASLPARIPCRSLLVIQVLVVLYALSLPVLLGWFTQHGLSRTHPSYVGHAFFLLSLAICGALVGAMFPLVSAACARLTPNGEARAGGALYAADLAGACAGALLVSAAMLPLWGVHQTCWGVALLCLSALPLLTELPSAKRNQRDDKEESNGEAT